VICSPSRSEASRLTIRANRTRSSTWLSRQSARCIDEGTPRHRRSARRRRPRTSETSWLSDRTPPLRRLISVSRVRRAQRLRLLVAPRRSRAFRRIVPPAMKHRTVVVPQRLRDTGVTDPPRWITGSPARPTPAGLAPTVHAEIDVFVVPPVWGRTLPSIGRRRFASTGTPPRRNDSGAARRAGTGCPNPGFQSARIAPVIDHRASPCSCPSASINAGDSAG
jgi:hypothetical protein